MDGWEQLVAEWRRRLVRLGGLEQLGLVQGERQKRSTFDSRILWSTWQLRPSDPSAFDAALCTADSCFFWSSWIGSSSNSLAGFSWHKNFGLPCHFGAGACHASIPQRSCSQHPAVACAGACHTSIPEKLSDTTCSAKFNAFSVGTYHTCSRQKPCARACNPSIPQRPCFHHATFDCARA